MSNTTASAFRTDTKIFTIEGYTRLVDGAAVQYREQWEKDPTAFTWQVTCQVTSGLIAECPAGIFVNIFFVTRKDAFAFYKALKAILETIRGGWFINMSAIDKMYILEVR